MRSLQTMWPFILIFYTCHVLGESRLIGPSDLADLPKVDRTERSHFGNLKLLQGGQVSIETVIEHHVVLLIIQDMTETAILSRHNEEKAALLRRLDRGDGTWDTNHPRARLLDALHGFSQYRVRNDEDLRRWRRLYKHVPHSQKKVLEQAVKYGDKFGYISSLLERNQILCNEVIRHALEFYNVEESEFQKHTLASEKAGRNPDKVSVSQALKHLVRDWPREGRSERENAFPCILTLLKDLPVPEAVDHGQPVRVLLPGAGLGRLGHEISLLGGFEVTNNEWSAYMNVMYRFLENIDSTDAYTTYPFVDSWSHHASTGDMVRGVAFPDIKAESSSVLLVEGDFTQVFRDRQAGFDVVITHFFIDTARNLLSYLETIWHVLTHGGYWVNFGPLLYGTAPWVQLSLEEIISVAEAMGMEFLDIPESCGNITIPGQKVRGMYAAYGFNERALTRNAYLAQLWVARKH